MSSEPLSVPLRVSTPVGDFVVVDRMCRSCTVSIQGQDTQVDLLLLKMLDFDVIGYGLVSALSRSSKLLY